MSRFKGNFKVAFERYMEFVAVMAEDIAFNDSTSSTKVTQKRNDVYVIVYDFLVNDPSADWCKHREFKQTIEESKKRGDFRPEKAATAFYHIEHYILFVLLMPWKEEYKKIKKFSGFYQNEIENNLTKAESILKLADFTECAHGILVWTKKHKREYFMDVAFECFVASTECKIISNSLEKAKLSKHSKLKVILGEGIPSEKDAGKYNTVMPTNVFDGRANITSVNVGPKSAADRSSTERYRTKLEEHLRKAQKLAGQDTCIDLPFIDDELRQSMDFEEGTLEDHVKASLQIVENNESTPTAYVEPVQRNISASQEWDFVHEGLKQKFGNQYFQGPRKDILNAENDNENDKNIMKQKQFNQSAKLGDNSWLQHINKNPDIEPKVNPNQSFFDSAYQSASQAQFPPSLSTNKQYLSRSASAGRKFDSDVLMKKSDNKNQDVPFSHTVPIVKRTSAPGVLRHKSDSLPKSFQKTYDSRVNDQGVETIQNYQNDLSKSTVPSTGLGVNQITGKPLVSSVGKTSGLGDSISSHVYISKSPSELISTRSHSSNAYDGQMTQNFISYKWPCINCTFLNDCSTNVCVMCSKTKDGQLDTDSPSVGFASKVCDQCTLQNDCNSTHCQACGNVLGGSQTVV